LNIRGNYNHTLLASYTGFITQAIINNFTPLLFITFQTNYQISLEKITFLVTANFGIQLLVDLLAILFVDKIGYRISIVSAHLFAAVGLFGLGLFPQLFTDPYSGLLLAVFCYAIGGGLIEVLVSPIVEACPTKNKAGNMSFLHSFYCWGSVFVILGSTIFFSLTGVENWKLLALIWAVVPMLNAVYFSQVPLAPLVEKDERMSLSAMFNTKVFWLFILLMICAGASEQAMSQWASAFAESGLGVSKTIGDLAGPGFFAVLMGLARVFYARISEKYNLMKFMLASSVLCIISYLLAAFSSLPLLSLLGCALCGLSVGIFWPGTLSIATRNCPKGGSALFAMLALAGDVGCSAGPTLVGMVSAAFGNNLKIGLAAAFIFPFLMFTGVAFSIKNKAKPY
jgi:fucose permease